MLRSRIRIRSTTFSYRTLWVHIMTLFRLVTKTLIEEILVYLRLNFKTTRIIEYHHIECTRYQLNFPEQEIVTGTRSGKWGIS